MQEFISQFLEGFQLPLQSPILVFSLILTIILLSPIILGRLNIPGIIGLIIAGIVIGPDGFHIIENSSAIELFSTIGLLYIMFIAGLELDLGEFKANRNKSLVFGLYTFLLPLGLGFPVVYYGLGYDFNASFLTASMFATHTLVAYPIVSKMGVSKNQAVAITVGGTILTDTAVLIILAVIMGNAEGSLGSEFWIKLGVSLTIFSLIMFLIIPRVAAWFFKKLKEEKHSHYIFVLSVIFFSAFLAEVAGVEAIIGAFMAGLALNKLIPPNSALMNRIEFLGNSLFIPFFLISVGMLVNVKVIFGGTGAWIVAGTLTVVAIAGKWIAAWLTQVTFKYTKAQRQVIFGLSGAHAAATLAVVLVGFNAGILDENILNGTIILILVASIVASFATEKAAKKIVIESANDTEGLARSSGATSEHILIPIDNINKIDSLMELSVLIKDKRSPNPISVLTVVDNDDDASLNLAEAKAKLEEFVQKNADEKTKVNVLTTIDHHAATGISRVSREIMIDFVIMGWPSRHTGFMERFISEDKIDTIIKKSDKTSFVCNLKKPLKSQQRIFITIPPFGEREIGFTKWLNKIVRLAEKLDIPIEIYCNMRTKQILEKILEKVKNPVINLNQFNDWVHFNILKKEATADDLLVFVSARKGATSYIRPLDNTIDKVEKLFPDNNIIAIFPQHYTDFNMKDTDISTEGLSKGIEAVQKVSKGIGSIFKKKK